MDVHMSVGSGERLLEELARAAQLASPAELPVVLNRYAEATGLGRAVIYLADLQQRLLLPLVEGEPALELDTSLAGWAYRTDSLRVEEGPSGGLNVWLPLADGAERLGVLELNLDTLDGIKLLRCRTMALVLALIITSKRAYSDTIAQRMRTRPMELPTEMVRAFLPPRSIGTGRVVSTAVLEPAYEVGGDAFDHSFTEDILHATILDGMGHNLASGLATSVAMSGGRNARRIGADLDTLVGTVDEALAKWLPDEFCTGIFTQLHMPTGELRWCNCGHPPPLLIRRHRLLHQALERPPEPPLGLPASLAGAARQVHDVGLEPGDRVLLYSDGVVESRNEEGEEFGLDRFTDYIIQTTAAGQSAPEALRLLIDAILEHRRNELSDDATILMFEWQPPGP
ncbi:PP2C family protein-serine/threonine phosphatase [Streptomyces sp. NPDC057067]|uniref:PP2C family protein-serine/threonine phosphatase n=1 Tax=Streptomyces silvae TaxID=2803812 RepID=A0ABU7ZV97_9ACTN|nr:MULTISPECIES: PP2C family protein-serine/threonine phosphatase [Streptomyces]WSS60085.1 serine/threonine-protein phosphatase [Streptomyces sp. NBC_01177]WSS67189.1 serine/threonine-protein phosphatase [Streptomyces sp. NBC_01175]WSS74105.1 serine/threonine-protein phosphatase [Streptomyces sp. NBC_01174]MBL1286941.1 serine/threonine-protein phosphatase [Streptomyces silvae]MDX3324680.1 PP2C family protein-serine/threonine phosphatase [Streptomyces sp. ME02-6979-3A]